MGPEMSRLVETVVGRSVLIWFPQQALRQELHVSYSLKRGSQETLLQEWGSKTGRGRQQIKATLSSKLLLWVPGPSCGENA